MPAPVPLDFVSSVLVSVFLTGVLSALAYRRDVLTWDGSLAAFVVGMVIGIMVLTVTGSRTKLNGAGLVYTEA